MNAHILILNPFFNISSLKDGPAQIPGNQMIRSVDQDGMHEQLPRASANNIVAMFDPSTNEFIPVPVGPMRHTCSRDYLLSGTPLQTMIVTLKDDTRTDAEKKEQVEQAKSRVGRKREDDDKDDCGGAGASDYGFASGPGNDRASKSDVASPFFRPWTSKTSG